MQMQYNISINKTGNTFCCETSVMQESTKVLENKWFFQLDPGPQGNFIPS